MARSASGTIAAGEKASRTLQLIRFERHRSFPDDRRSPAATHWSAGARPAATGSAAINSMHGPQGNLPEIPGALAAARQSKLIMAAAERRVDSNNARAQRERRNGLT
eukprot:5307020-Pleurochrysis_carterae.AAC.1